MSSCIPLVNSTKVIYNIATLCLQCAELRDLIMGVHVTLDPFNHAWPNMSQTHACLPRTCVTKWKPPKNATELCHIGTTLNTTDSIVCCAWNDLSSHVSWGPYYTEYTSWFKPLFQRSWSRFSNKGAVWSTLYTSERRLGSTPVMIGTQSRI